MIQSGFNANVLTTTCLMDSKRHSHYSLALVEMVYITPVWIDGLMQKKRKSIATTLELRLFCIQQSKCNCMKYFALYVLFDFKTTQVFHVKYQEKQIV